jgi:hypothetical protein
MSHLGHFETKSDAYRSASIGLILIQELTFWRSGSKVGAYAAMSSLDSETERMLTDLANAAGRGVGGAWSIDILETRRGWMVTDMAEAAAGLSGQRCPRWTALPVTRYQPISVTVDASVKPAGSRFFAGCTCAPLTILIPI